MAENVVFDNQQVNTGQIGPNADSGIQTPPQPQAIPGDESQVQPGGEGEPPEDGEPPVDDAEAEYVDEPPTVGIWAKLRKLILRSESSGAPPDDDTPKSNKLKIILIIAGIILILIILFILIIPKNQRGKDVTLVWWGLWEDSSTMQSVIDSFEKQNPQIKIEYIKQDPEKYRDTVLTRIKNGTGPDIFRYHNTWAPVFYDILAPLPKDVITADDFKKQYYPVIQNDLMQNGAIYGIPIGIDSIALFINTDLLNDAGLSVPKDWKQFIDAARKMTVKDASTKKIQTSGAALGTYENIKHAPDILSLMFLQQGIDMKKIAQSKEDIINAIRFYTSFSRGDEAIWDGTLDNSMLAFARGHVAMYFGLSWDVFDIEQLKANDLKYEIHAVPSLVGGKNISVVSYWAEGVSSRSKNQKEAMLFMHYLTQKDTLQRFYTSSSKSRAFGEPYPRVDMAQELKSNPIVYPFISQLGNSGSSYFVSDTHDGDTGLNKRANSYLENAINAIVNDNSSIESEVGTLLEGVAKVIEENGIK